MIQKTIKMSIICLLICVLVFSQIPLLANADNTAKNEVVLCDLNQDGVTNAEDALEILKFTAKLMSPSYKQLAYADLNCDCKITSEDALVLLKLIVKLIHELPNTVEYVTIKEQKYTSKDLEYIISVFNNGLEVDDEAKITRFAIGDVYQGGKPELILIDNSDSKKTYIYSEIEGRIKLDICETAMRYNIAYLGYDIFDVYGNVFTYDIEKNPIEQINLIYLNE